MNASRAILVGLLLLSGLGSARAQTPRKVVPFEGTQGFCQFLHYYGLKPIRQLTDLKAREKWSQTVVIVLGGTQVLDQLPIALEEFASGGGAILLASDQADLGRLADFRLTIPGGAVRADQRERAYHNEPDCPLIVPRVRHPLVANLDYLPTNRPSFLIQRRRQPADLELHFEDAPARLFLVARDQPPFVVLAGQGVFFNGMLCQPDLQNYRFTDNVVRFLSENKRRQHCLFVENERIVESFDVSLGLPPRLPMPPLQKLEELANSLGSEDLDFLAWEDDSRQTILQVLLLLATLGLFAWAGFRWLGGRHGWEPSVPLIVGRPDRPDPQPSPWQQRMPALLKQGPYGEPAQALVRQWFWEQLDIAPPAWDQPNPPRPRAVHAGGWWRRWRWNRRLRQWAELAVLGLPLTARQLRQLWHDLGEAQRLVRARQLVVEA